MILLFSRILYGDKNERIVVTWSYMDEFYRCFVEEKLNIEENILYGIIYIKFKNRLN